MRRLCGSIRNKYNNEYDERIIGILIVGLAVADGLAVVDGLAMAGGLVVAGTGAAWKQGQAGEPSAGGQGL